MESDGSFFTRPAPPPTKCTISNLSPIAIAVVGHSARETMLPFCSMATRSPFSSRAAIRSATVAEADRCRQLAAFPLMIELHELNVPAGKGRAGRAMWTAAFRGDEQPQRIRRQSLPSGNAHQHQHA